MATRDEGHVLIDLEPDGTRAVPAGQCLALGNFGHVGGQRARVVDVGVGGPGDTAAGFDGRIGRAAAATGGQLVAADSVRRDVGNGSIAVVVSGDTDGLPVGRALDVRECVCVKVLVWPRTGLCTGEVNEQ